MVLKYCCMSIAGESKGDRDCCFQHARRAWRFHRTLPNRCPVQQVCSNPLLPHRQSQVHACFLLFMFFTFCCKLILMTAGGLQRLLHAADVRVGRFQHRCCCHDSQCALSPAAGHDACVQYCLMVCAQHSRWCATPVCRMSWLHLQRLLAGSCTCFGVLHCRHMLYHLHFAPSTDFYWVFSTSHIDIYLGRVQLALCG